MRQCKFLEFTSRFISRICFYASKISFAPNLLARLYLADIFFNSGLAKIDDWKGTLFLFKYEYKVPLLSPSVAAYSSALIELICPILLVLGLGTRFVSFILFCMSYVIIISFIESSENYYWMLIFSMLIVYGGDKLSLDHLLKKYFKTNN